MRSFLKLLHSLEDSLLFILLTAMIGLGAWQMIMRNLFDSSYTWIDPLLRLLVLWVGLVGAMVATRQQRHISVDALTRWVPDAKQPLFKALSNFIAFGVAGVIGYASISFVGMDYEAGSVAFAGIPSWVCELILPFAFLCMAVRFLCYSIQNLHTVWRSWHLQKGKT